MTRPPVCPPETVLENIRNQLRYDPKTGDLWWKSPRRGRTPGVPAGNFDKDGYKVVQLDGKTYGAHRIVWFLVTGRWPEGRLDHRFGNRSDNRFENLREATALQNAVNRRLLKPSETGWKGVRFQTKSGRHEAQITIDGKTVSLGTFLDPLEAAFAYDKAATQLHGEFAVTNFKGFDAVIYDRSVDRLPSSRSVGSARRKQAA